AALRVIRLHTMREYGDPAPPYPLLIVRPDGIDTYGAARRAMKDWDDQFGYELVPDYVDLAFTKPDPRLKERVDFAIRDATAHQNALEAIARGGGRGGGGGSFSRGRVGGGQTSGTSGGSRRLPTLSAASLDRDGRANGFRSHRDSAYASSQGNRGPYVGSSPYTHQSQSQNFSNDDAGAAAREWAAKMRSAAAEMRKNETGDQVGNGLLDPQGSQAGAMPTVAGGNQSDLANGGPPQTGFARENPYAPGNASPHLSDNASNGVSSENTRTGSQSIRGQNGGDQNESQSQHQGGLEMPQQGPGGTGSQSNGLADAGDPTESKQDRGEGSSTTTQAAQAQTMGNGGMQASGSGASQPTAQSTNNATPDQSQNAAPTISADMSSRPEIRREGKDWALPKSVAGIHGNAIVRTIRVQCYADRFVLLAPGSGGATEMFGFSNGDIERATMKLASAVRERIDRWGPALPGGRWEPRMDVIVMPRGDVRFHQLRTLMRDSGVEVVGRATQ
ncbi:MAG: hypothetical protein ACR2NZ_01190, partial [Rubripirellula sp.]